MNLRHIWAGGVNRMLRPTDITDSHLDGTVKVMGGGRIDRATVGKYTYLGADVRLILADVGAFCSIAGGCRIGGGAHAAHFVSTSPLFCEGSNVFGRNFARNAFDPYRKTLIGSDVWIGADAHIRGGVSISHGAIIGMGAVLTKDVGPYEVWAGNPARLIKKRFDEKTIAELLKMAWWEWPIDKIERLAPLFDDPNELIAHESGGEDRP